MYLCFCFFKLFIFICGFSANEDWSFFGLLGTMENFKEINEKFLSEKCFKDCKSGIGIFT